MDMTLDYRAGSVLPPGFIARLELQARVSDRIKTLQFEVGIKPKPRAEINPLQFSVYSVISVAENDLKPS